jgi:hypothetical protein
MPHWSRSSFLKGFFMLHQKSFLNFNLSLLFALMFALTIFVLPALSEEGQSTTSKEAVKEAVPVEAISTPAPDAVPSKESEVVTPPLNSKVASVNSLSSSLKDRTERVIQAGWMNRFPDGQFHPERLVTRAELATVLVKAFDLTKRSGSNKENLPISDVKTSHWAFPAIQTMLKTDTMLGYHNTQQFYPNHLVSRAEGYAIIAQAYGVYQFEPDSLKELLAPYQDRSQIPYWANKAIATSIREGFIHKRGKSPQSHLYPMDPLTRGDLVYALDVYLSRKTPMTSTPNETIATP